MSWQSKRGAHRLKYTRKRRLIRQSETWKGNGKTSEKGEDGKNVENRQKEPGQPGEPAGHS